jgi:hypothetical protein
LRIWKPADGTPGIFRLEKQGEPASFQMLSAARLSAKVTVTRSSACWISSEGIPDRTPADAMSPKWIARTALGQETCDLRRPEGAPAVQQA